MYLMRILLDIVRQSLSTLWAHKLRSFLTMFGIAWGVGSLLLLVGLGEGFRSGQEKNMAELGADIMFIFPGRIPAVVGSYQSGQPYYFTYADYFAIRDQNRFLRAVSPVLERDDIRAVSDFGSTNGQVFGVVPEYNQIRTLPTDPGRWTAPEFSRLHGRTSGAKILLAPDPVSLGQCAPRGFGALCQHRRHVDRAPSEEPHTFVTGLYRASPGRHGPDVTPQRAALQRR